jgi:hypothetical protein
VCKVYPDGITSEIREPAFPNLIWQFIYKQQLRLAWQDSNDVSNQSNASIPNLPMFYGKISIYPSAITTFHAPSNISGIGSMCCECICAVKSWRKGPGHYDMIFVNTDFPGMGGLDIAHVQLFFLFSHDGVYYSCALVCWFTCMADSPDDCTGMWVVEPDDEEHPFSIIHLNSVVRVAHLLPVFGSGTGQVPKTLSFTDTLDTFKTFYVNKFVDHHAFKIIF